VKKKGMSRQDCTFIIEVTHRWADRVVVETIDRGPKKKLATESFVELPASLRDLGVEKDTGQAKKAKVNLKDIRAQHERDRLGDRSVGNQKVSPAQLTISSAAREAEIKRMQADLRKLKKQSGNGSDSDSDSDAGRRKAPSYLEQELAKYSKQKGLAAKQRQVNRKGRKDEEDDLLEAMSHFSKRVKRADEADREGERLTEQDDADGEGIGEGEAEPVPDVDGEIDDDVGWMRHSLKFLVDEKELTRRAEDEYAVSYVVHLYRNEVDGRRS
jgi:peptidyl-prolyl cis-trans isomerase SDCCAG10